MVISVTIVNHQFQRSAGGRFRFDPGRVWSDHRASHDGGLRYLADALAVLHDMLMNVVLFSGFYRVFIGMTMDNQEFSWYPPVIKHGAKEHPLCKWRIFLGGRLIKLIGRFSSKPCVIDSQRVGGSQYIYTYIIYMYIYIVVLIKCHNIPFISG